MSDLDLGLSVDLLKIDRECALTGSQDKDRMYRQAHAMQDVYKQE